MHHSHVLHMQHSRGNSTSTSTIIVLDCINHCGGISLLTSSPLSRDARTQRDSHTNTHTTHSSWPIGSTRTRSIGSAEDLLAAPAPAPAIMHAESRRLDTAGDICVREMMMDDARALGHALMYTVITQRQRAPTT